MQNNRRRLLQTMAVLPVLGPLGFFAKAKSSVSQSSEQAHYLKLSLNAYSFNQSLVNGSMTLDDLLQFCSDNGISGADLTGYYFPGYPAVPPDDYIYHIKQHAFRLGVGISGTGVRNDFTEPDAEKRKVSVQLVKKWIECASKLGAPVIRIFAGTQNPSGFTWDQVAEWMIKDIAECVDYGKKYGVVVGLQNHNDFIKTADDVKKIFAKYNSDWFGLILDTGSYRSGDPYAQIQETIRFAVNWQLKENIFVNGSEQPADIEKILGIIKASKYRGYVPIETLGPGDPKQKILAFLQKVRMAFNA